MLQIATNCNGQKNEKLQEYENEVFVLFRDEQELGRIFLSDNWNEQLLSLLKKEMGLTLSDISKEKTKITIEKKDVPRSSTCRDRLAECKENLCPIYKWQGPNGNVFYLPQLKIKEGKAVSVSIPILTQRLAKEAGINFKYDKLGPLDIVCLIDKGESTFENNVMNKIKFLFLSCLNLCCPFSMPTAKWNTKTCV